MRNPWDMHPTPALDPELCVPAPTFPHRKHCDWTSVGLVNTWRKPFLLVSLQYFGQAGLGQGGEVGKGEQVWRGPQANAKTHFVGCSYSQLLLIGCTSGPQELWPSSHVLLGPLTLQVTLIRPTLCKS